MEEAVGKLEAMVQRADSELLLLRQRLLLEAAGSAERRPLTNAVSLLDRVSRLHMSPCLRVPASPPCLRVPVSQAREQLTRAVAMATQLAQLSATQPLLLSDEEEVNLRAVLSDPDGER